MQFLLASSAVVFTFLLTIIGVEIIVAWTKRKGNKP